MATETPASDTTSSTTICANGVVLDVQTEGSKAMSTVLNGRTQGDSTSIRTTHGAFLRIEDALETSSCDDSTDNSTIPTTCSFSGNRISFSSNSRSRRGSSTRLGMGSRRRSSGLHVPVTSITARVLSERVLSEMTVNKLRFERLNLCGREKEIQHLKDAYHGCFNTRSSIGNDRIIEKRPNAKSLVLVSGSAGVGKSALCHNTLQPLLQRSRGFFLTGKFGLQQNDEPFAGIASCCSELCEQVIGYASVQQDSFDDQEQEQHLRDKKDDKEFTIKELQLKLHDELGSEAQLLTSVLPSLLPIIGSIGNDAEQGNTIVNKAMGPMEAKDSLNHAWRRFVRVLISTLGRPIVFMIDDLQWSDEASLQLLDGILRDLDGNGETESGLLVVGTYRDDEVDDGHELMKWLNDFKLETERRTRHHQAALTLQTIPVGNLDLEATTEILVELLDTSRAEAGPLAECIYHKTHGNAFFTVEFLQSLQRHELLQFHLGTFAWKWDLDEIQKGTNVTDNVVDLVSSKLNELPLHIRAPLPLVASLGPVFRYDLFELMVTNLGPLIRASLGTTTSEPSTQAIEPDEETAKNILATYEIEGLLEPHGSDSYRWVHDKIQGGAMALIGSDKLEALQFELGKLLLRAEHGTGANSDEGASFGRNTFILVNLFRGGSFLLDKDDPQRLQIAKLNLAAGIKAIEASSFAKATSYLSAGIDLLPRNKWAAHYQLCLDLHSTAAEAFFCVGNLETMQYHCDEVFRHTEGKPLLDRRRAYNTNIRGLMSDGRTAEARDLNIFILKQIGITFPRSGVDFAVLFKVLKTQMNARKAIAKLQQCQPTTDEMASWTAFLLFGLLAACYQSGSKLLPLAIVRGLEFTLKTGISDQAPSIVGTVGLMMAAHLDDLQTGRLFAEQALSLLSRPISKNYEAQTLFVLGNFTMHWTSPINECLKMLARGYHSGLACGDSTYGFWCIMAYLEISFYIGASLDALAQDCQVYTGEMRQFKQRQIHVQTLVIWQCVQNMMGESDDPFVLKGAAVDEDAVLDEAMDPMWTMLLHRNQICVAVILGDFERAVKIILEKGFHKKALEKAAPGAFSLTKLYFYCTIATVSMARETKKRKFRVLAKYFAKQVNQWADQGNPNVVHQAALIAAEQLDLKGDTANADAWFQKAIVLSGRRGFRNDHAMAHERFGDFLVRQGDTREATHHYNQAIRLHDEWGAIAKVALLKARHEKLLCPPIMISIDAMEEMSPEL